MLGDFVERYIDGPGYVADLVFFAWANIHDGEARLFVRRGHHSSCRSACATSLADVPIPAIQFFTLLLLKLAERRYKWNAQAIRHVRESLLQSDSTIKP